MNSRDIAKLRQAILTACSGKATDVQSILIAKGVQPYVTAHGERRVKETIYALVTAGLLHRTGNKRFAFYRTSRLGRETLPLHTLEGL